MATKHDTSKAHPGRNPAAAEARSASSPPKPASAAPNPKSLEDIVEDERSRMMKAHSILSCVITAMEDEVAYSGDGPYWPSVIESARDLIDESIRRLEDLDYSAKPVSRRSHEVREPARDYGYGVASGSTFLSTRDVDDELEYRATENADIAASLRPSLKTH